MRVPIIELSGIGIFPAIRGRSATSLQKIYKNAAQLV